MKMVITTALPYKVAVVIRIKCINIGKQHLTKVGSSMIQILALYIVTIIMCAKTTVCTGPPLTGNYTADALPSPCQSLFCCPLCCFNQDGISLEIKY